MAFSSAPSDSVGMLLWGMVISAILYGVAALQLLIYLKTYPKDSWYLKSYVVFVFVLDTLQLVFMTRAVYVYLVLDFGDDAALSRVLWSIIVEIILTMVITYAARLFFIHRVWIVSGYSKWITGTILLIATAQLAEGFYVIWVFFTGETFDSLKIPRNNLAIIVYSVASQVDDTCICLALGYYLWRSRSRAGFRRTDRMLKLLTIWTVNSGLMMDVGAFVSMITYLASPNTLLFLAIQLWISKVYTNCLLASLNNRRRFRNVGYSSGSIPECQCGHGNPAKACSPPGSTGIVFRTFDERSSGVHSGQLYETSQGNEDGLDEYGFQSSQKSQSV